MPDPSARQGDPLGHRPRTFSSWCEGEGRPLPIQRSAFRRLIVTLLALLPLFWPAWSTAQSRTDTADKGRFDIGVIIDNRPSPENAAAKAAFKADVDALFMMLDQQMLVEHIMVFERPTIEVICDLFGCPETIEPANPFPPLIWQITRKDQARLVVYYIGEGRVEGLERQLLFKRRDDGPEDDVVALAVDWLHRMLQAAEPIHAVLMLDTGFSPRPLPCASEDPRLISDALLGVRRNYQQVMRDSWNGAGNLELSATTPVQPPHCDRFDQVLNQEEQPLFTKFVLNGIVGGEADQDPFGDGDGLIELSELEDYLDDRISRAARFQWGRLQNVRAQGSRSRVLASIDRRGLTGENAELMARRRRSDEGPRNALVPEAGGDGGPIDEPTGDEADDIGGDEPPESPEETPRREPDTLAASCPEGEGSGLCAPGLTATTETDSGEPGMAATAGRAAEKADDAALERSAVCRWIVDHVAPYSATLVQRIRGDTASSCAWAADRSEPTLGPVGQIFTPIGWRLGRAHAQDAVLCLLDCDHQAMARAHERAGPADDTDAAGRAGPAAPEERGAPGDIADRPPLTLPPGPPRPQGPPVDPRTLGPFEREICDRLDEPLPAYIGLPRWMPGPLIVSESLRIYHGCPPLPPEPELPLPFAIAIAPPEDENETPAPTPERAPDVAAADGKLGRHPPSAADVARPQDEPAPPTAAGSQAAADSRVAADGRGMIDIETADAAPPDGDEPAASDGDPFVETVGRVRWLQSALTVDNRNPGPIDGAMGEKTEAAIHSWRLDNGQGDRTGKLTETEFKTIIEDFGRRFDQLQERVRAF